MEPNDIAIATISLAREPAEERLLLHALSALDARGIAMFIADGGSPGSFVAELGALAHATLVEPHRRGLVGQVSASLDAARASGARRVLYTEPDKLDFFEHRLDDLLMAAGDAEGVSIAARSPAAFATFPPMQRTAESAINGVAAALLGRTGDYCYGPFLLDPDLARHVASLPDDLGWGWRFAVFVAAHRQSRSIEHVEGPFECPADQRVENDRDRLYRIAQLEQNVRGTLIGARLEL